MDVAASTFPPGSASPSRADKKPQEAAEGFQPAFDSFFIHFSSSLWLLQSKYILWSLRESFKRNKIHELINLPKLWVFFQTLVSSFRSLLLKISLSYFPQSTADMKIIYLFIFTRAVSTTRGFAIRSFFMDNVVELSTRTDVWEG